MPFLVALTSKYSWYLIGLGILVLSLTGLYFYVKHKGAEEYKQKVIKQTEKIVQEREKTDEKINHLSDDELRAALRLWVCHDTCSAD